MIWINDIHSSRDTASFDIANSWYRVRFSPDIENNAITPLPPLLISIFRM